MKDECRSDVRSSFILPPSSFHGLVLDGVGLAQVGGRNLKRLSFWASPTSPERADRPPVFGRSDAPAAPRPRAWERRHAVYLGLVQAISAYTAEMAASKTEPETSRPLQLLWSSGQLLGSICVLAQDSANMAESVDGTQPESVQKAALLADRPRVCLASASYHTSRRMA